MWLTSIALQVAALRVVPLLLGWEFAGFGADASSERGRLLYDTNRALDSTPRAAGAADARPLTMTRTPLPNGDTLVRIAGDSSFLAFRTSGGPVEASPDVQKAAGVIAGAFTGMFDALFILLTVLAVIVLGPTLAMGAITLTWAVQRRRDRRSTT